jgi:hypothetical protein
MSNDKATFHLHILQWGICSIAPAQVIDFSDQFLTLNISIFYFLGLILGYTTPYK